MFAITSIGFPLFALLLVPLWYRTAPARPLVCHAGGPAGVFYLSIDPPGLPLLAVATAVVWLAAKRLNTEPAGRAKPRFWLAVGLAAALGPLLALKYSGVVYAPFRGFVAAAGPCVFQPAAHQLSGGCIPRADRSRAPLQPAAVLCGLFSVHHTGSLQPL